MDRAEPATDSAAALAAALDHYRHGRSAAAASLLDAALAADSANVALLNLAGVVARALARLPQAEALWRAAIALRPDALEAHYNLGGLLFASRRYAEAESSFRRALELAPQNVSVLNNLGSTLELQARLDEALACYERAVALDPRHARAQHNRGLVLKALGREAEAVAALEAALDLAPNKAPFFRSFAYSHKFVRGDPRLREMEALAQNAAALSPNDRMQLDFALGKAWDDIGDYARAFGHFAAGNAARRAATPYDEAAMLDRFRMIRAAFPPAPDPETVRRAEPPDLPVFVVGMPRSGSSLVEQILASHPQACGVGETDDFEHLAEALQDAGGRPLTSAAHDRLPEAALARLGRDYRHALLARAQHAGKPFAQRIVDKTLRNLLHLGLIHRALPSARIVHVQRDAADTCLSCYALLFNGDHPYAYDLGELARYWRACDELMAHWRSVLPPGVLLEIRYENLVDDPEAEARRLLAHCGLEWDAACLDFHRTQRAVRTASLSQVRQPLYRHAVGRSQAYGALLKPLFDALGTP